jgi:hypothetical protein
MKKPTTAVLVIGGLAGLFFFVSFTVQVRVWEQKGPLFQLL